MNNTELNDMLKSYGITGLGATLQNYAKSNAHLPQLVLAFGQIKAAGKITQNELRQIEEASRASLTVEQIRRIVNL